MLIEQLHVGFMAVFCYIVACETSKEALVIDPGGSEDLIVKHLNNKNYKLKYIVNTHGHGDHTCGNKRIQDLTGAKIIMHIADEKLYNSPDGHARSRAWGFEPSPPADITVEDGDNIVIGKVTLKILHTPGHSPGGICLLSEENVFTGDTLFVGGIGRTDLLGSNGGQFMKSIRDKLLTLPDNTIVWPGHDYGQKPSSTIGEERTSNPWIM